MPRQKQKTNKKKGETVPSIKQKPKFKSSLLIIAALIAVLGGFYYIWSTFAGTCDNMANGRAKVACYAGTYVGNTQEGKTDYRINSWNQEFGCDNGDPWCASFASKMLRMGLGRNPANTCYTGTMVEEARAHGTVYDFDGGYYKLYPGDILYKQRAPYQGQGHVGIVSAYYSDGSFTTIEGNTSCPGGDCVAKKNYRKNGTPKDNSTSVAWEKILRF